jgi:Family of unknown function (DUF6311)/Interleukin-like EMT inducer
VLETATKFNAMFKIFRNTEGSVYGAAMLIGVVVFLLKFSAHVLNPYNCDWLLGGGDDTTEYISWLYYRSTPFTFPVIGTLTGYDYPTSTGVGLTGAIPLIAIPMKFLTHGQNTDFQYFGWWFLACYVLQGYFSVRLMKAIAAFKNVKIAPIAYVLASVFFVVSPALLTRTGHINLCGQWLILWGFTIYFESKNRRQAAFNFLKIVAVTALVHQYLLLMVFGIGFATFWRLALVEKQATDSFFKRVFSWIKNLFFNVSNVALAMILWFFIGNFNAPTDTMKQVGFGTYSANLNTFFNGQGEQKLFKTFDFNEGQYEGFGYLGLGLLLLTAFSLVIAVVLFVFKLFKSDASTDKNALNQANNPPNKYFSWFSQLGFISFLFAAYSFSNVWFFGHAKVLTAVSFYDTNHNVDYLSQAFRASGRFVWVFHYFLMSQIIIAFLKLKISNGFKISILATLIVVQAIDISPMIRRERKYFDFDGYQPSAMTPKIWAEITAEAQRIVMLPPHVWRYKSEGDYFHFARLTALKNQEITTGYLARPDWKAHEIYRKKILNDLEHGDLADEQNSIFVAGGKYLPKLKKLVASGQVKAFEYEDYAVAVPLKFEKTIQYLTQLPNCQPLRFDRPDLTEFLKLNSKDRIILAVVKDEATEQLCNDAKKQFADMGIDIVQLGFRGSFAAIIIDGKSVFSGIDNKKAVLKTVKKGDILRGPLFLKDIELQSAGGEVGNFGKIIVDGKDYSPALRGFNFVVLDKQFKILQTAYFDTYDDCTTGEVRNQ